MTYRALNLRTVGTDTERGVSYNAYKCHAAGNIGGTAGPA